MKYQATISRRVTTIERLEENRIDKTRETRMSINNSTIKNTDMVPAMTAQKRGKKIFLNQELQLSFVQHYISCLVLKELN